MRLPFSLHRIFQGREPVVICYICILVDFSFIVKVLHFGAGCFDSVAIILTYTTTVYGLVSLRKQICKRV